MDAVLKRHYLDYGQAKNLSYKLVVPDDFSISKFIELNSDLHTLKIQNYFSSPIGDINAEEAYMYSAGLQNRIYKLELPEDFCVNDYKKYNKDLVDLPDDYVKAHYVRHAEKEGRVYKLDLPTGFDVTEYKHLNPDLLVFTDPEAEKHYVQHGCREGRQYRDEYFDRDYFSRTYSEEGLKDYKDYLSDPRRLKSASIAEKVESIQACELDLLLVSHETSLYGATHYLYTLYTYIKKNYPNVKVKIAEKYINAELLAKYELNELDMYYYLNDCTLLYHIIKKSNPTKVLVNSTPTAINAIAGFFPGKLIYHSHEVKEHFDVVMPGVTPDYVVSHRIADQWAGTPKVQPPFFSEAVLKALERAPQFTVEVANRFGVLDTSKLTIGMCGNLSERKNPDLFMQLAEELPDYNFLWVGGYDEITNKEINNLYHVKNVAEPYSYFQVFDYFSLTAKIDPCPYVVVEALYYNIPVLVFKENIYTTHNLDSSSEMYFELPGSISLETAKQAILSLCVKHKDKYNAKGREYVLEHFTKPTNQYIADVLNSSINL